MIFQSGFSAKMAHAETWKIASLEWPPYSSSSLSSQGTAITRLRSLLARAGISLEVEFMPWTRARAISVTKDFVGYFPASPSEVGKGYIPTKPVAFSRVGIIKRVETTLSWTTVEDLFAKYRIGFVRNHIYPADLQRLIYQHYQPEDGTENEEDLARILAAGRVDAALTDPEVILLLADKLSLNGIDKSAEILQAQPLSLAIHRSSGYEERLDLLNELIEKDTGPKVVCCLSDTPPSDNEAR
ncbi:hypothetical protein [Labrenzia sp. DG1229]|uniref:substrate-binding periplasmic protein n=1 Tax=Labrenzia sp. DG1229 TaxID=681847 RepID=UPI0012EB3B13|nr:hypothetical protein [Labrenzia sp. DG1229]